MKILQLVDSLNFGGTERMSINMANLFSEKGIENILVSTRRGGPMVESLNQSTVYLSLKKKSGLDIRTFLKLCSFVKKHQPDVIHAHSTSIYWGTLLKIIYPKLKLIWHDHFGLSDQLEQYPRKELHFFLKFTEAILVVNEKLAVWWKAKQIVPEDRIFLISNFPYMEFKGRERMNNPVKVLHLANFRRQKDHLNLLKALRLIHLEAIDFNLSLVGQIVEEDYYEEIKLKIKEYGLSGKIIFMGPSNEVNKLLNESDIAVLSSISEGLPVALLEYGLAALPTICTHVGDCGKVLPSDHYGWLIPAQSPKDLANALTEVILDQPQALQRGENLRGHVLKNFGPEQFHQLYQEILADHPKV